MELILAPHNMHPMLELELGFKKIKVIEDWGRLKLIEDFDGPLWFVQSRARQAQKIQFSSIKEAARLLQAIHPRWASYSVTLHRRAELIESELRCGPKLFHPHQPQPTLPCGMWALIDHNTLFCGVTDHSAPLGEAHMQEDHIHPPSRAYLKLWELFTFHHTAPSPGTRVCDLGASPGGWSWALAETFATKVLAVDRSELDQRLGHHPRIHFQSGDAFALSPTDHPELTWVFSDVICYPEKLCEFFQQWLEVNPAIKLVGTIKLQGKTDLAAIEAFAKIPKSKIVHLFHNKHELTFFNSDRS